MAKIRYINDDHKEFQKDFDVLCRTRQRWQVWSDFVHMAAYSISNAVDTVHREKREAEYLKIASRYTATEMEAVARLLSMTVIALETNPDQDFLGELYMRLDLGNANAGQFFTPYCVSKMMAVMNVGTATTELEHKGFISVSDCCVGGGAMLIAFANACRDQKLNYQQNVLFVGQDIDHTVGMMAYIQLSLLGCPGYIVIGNSLTEPLTGDPLYAPMERETYITPFYCSVVWNTRRILRAVDAMFKAVPSEPEEEPKPKEEPAPKIVPKAKAKISESVQLSIFDMEV